MKISCYIIDDEPLAIEVLESHISKLDSIEVSGTFQNAIRALEALKDKPVDLLFLDIQMPKLTGLDFLKSLKNPPNVILTTAYREYALDGFELNVVDYLLKPISFERFMKAVNKVFDLHALKPGSMVSAGQDEDPIFISSGNRQVKIRLAEILFLESRRDYVHIQTMEKEVKTHATLQSMEEKLPSDRFLRIHRSFVVNLPNIESWSQTEIEVGGTALPIGRSYKNHVVKLLEKKLNRI